MTTFGHDPEMPHTRARSAVRWIKKLATFWPAVGILGLRQVGKTTLLREQMGLSQFYTLDDEDTRAHAEASAKVFLAQIKTPVTLDEVQKIPKLFEALKSSIDRHKRPGQFFLTGSTQFSAKIGIRESLTGRIGMLQLYPMTLREMHSNPTQARLDSVTQIQPLHQEKLVFQTEHVAAAMDRGGMPVPAFLRDAETQEIYWKNWLDTMVYRDVGKVYGRNYDPEITMELLRTMSKTFLQGRHPTYLDFKYSARKLRPYFEAMEMVFLLRRFRPHELATGRDIWLFGDSGLANFLLGNKGTPEKSLTLARHFILNEILAQNEYQGKSLPLIYFKSARGSPIDLVWNGIPIKISETFHSSMGWQTRVLEGAMKKLRSDLGILVAPTDHLDIPKSRKGIAVVPWSFWS
jgi:predicted AAA+ superfamily ATPase